MSRNQFARWRTRVVAAVLDAIPVVAIWATWEGIAVGSAVNDCITYDSGGVVCTAVAAPERAVFGALAVVLTVGWFGWNYGYRQGRSGATVGKSLLRVRVLGEATGRPVGFGTSLLRQVVHLVDVLTVGLGFLFPLWDRKRQTLADKLMGTVCVPAPGRGVSGRR